MENKILTHYGMFSLNHHYWKLSVDERKTQLKAFLKDIAEVGEKTWFYQVYPTTTAFDILVWSNVVVTDNDVPKEFMHRYAKATNHYREFIDPKTFFWGMTKPSIYSKAKRSAQEIDPFEDRKFPYFVIYPFSKTAEWYMMTREQRQEMMNDHIKIGKSYSEITQLLLYSFGLQDQEFIVAYETGDLAQFSDLVYELRMTKARIYTLLDTPIVTGTLHQPEELVKLFSGK